MKNLINILFIIVAFTGCSISVIKSTTAPEQLKGAVVVLPIETTSEIAREKIDYIENALVRELSNKGYAVLNSSIAKNICKEKECPERTELATKYGAKNFLKLELDSTTQSNVLAGYYNQLSGKLILENQNKEPLVTVEHTEREKGGLIFNTGSVIEAFRSASKGFEDSSTQLADKFVTDVVSQLPAPDKNLDVLNANKVKIDRVNVSPLGDSRYKICAFGSPSANAKFIINTSKYSLREITNGQYCNVILSDISGEKTLNSRVLLESPYGDSSSKDFMLPEIAQCNPATIIYKGGQSKIDIGCQLSNDKQKCEEDIVRCRSANFYVYRSFKEEGPFEKVGVVSRQSWNDPKYDERGSYTVLAVSPEGSTSIPFQLK